MDMGGKKTETHLAFIITHLTDLVHGDDPLAFILTRDRRRPLVIVY
jgi:hypothetical protein